MWASAGGFTRNSIFEGNWARISTLNRGECDGVTSRRRKDAQVIDMYTVAKLNLGLILLQGW